MKKTLEQFYNNLASKPGWEHIQPFLKAVPELEAEIGKRELIWFTSHQMLRITPHTSSRDWVHDGILSIMPDRSGAARILYQTNEDFKKRGYMYFFEEGGAIVPYDELVSAILPHLERLVQKKRPPGQGQRMLRVHFNREQSELLLNGRRQDYEQFCDEVRFALISRTEVVMAVQSFGETPISCLVVREDLPPNRVSYDGERIIFSIAHELQDQFLSFVTFPADADLPKSPIQYHHHFDGIADDGTYVAPDSLPVVFGLDTA